MKKKHREFDCGGVSVSMGTMNFDPLGTVQAVAERSGLAQAKRLFEFWKSTLPQIGFNQENYIKAYEVSNWLLKESNVR